MRQLYLGEQKRSYRTAVLVPKIVRDEILKHYVWPFGINPADLIVLELYTAPGKKKTSMADMRRWITEELTPKLEELGVEYLVVGDGEYFKALTKAAKSDAYAGYVVPSEMGPWQTVYVPNHSRVFYDPEPTKLKIRQGFEALLAHQKGEYAVPGEAIIKFAAYPETVEDIKYWLLRLLDEKRPLAADIEAFSLKHYDAGIGSICFAWNQHEGIAFPVDFLEREDALEVRLMLRQFFEHFNETLLWHNISYDAYVLIYQLFMDHILDTEGMLHGLEVMLKNWHDTKLISYLATNSCAGNHLSLKEQAQEFAGNYAVEVTNIAAVPLPELLQYNLIDGMSTWYVFNKHWQTLIDDEQLDVYENIFKPAIVDIIQMQLTGMPIDMVRVGEVKEILSAAYEKALTDMQNVPFLQKYLKRERETWAREKNAARQEVERRNLEAGRRLQNIVYTPEQSGIEFNPNSGPQLQTILFEDLDLPVLDKTKTGLPSTGAETLNKLKNATTVPEILDFLDALIAYKAVDKILNSFIPAFETAVEGPDGHHYLFGNFNLGGTVSGRLSSSKPNLQNLPSNVTMAISDALMQMFPELAPFVKKGKLSLGKLIKSCFKAPPGWIFCGIDFNSLEDRISALTTKDPEKLKVYTDGFDGHSLRAYSYFGDQMPDIDGTSVESINSIADKYPNLRQDSKAPTFALTYAGTYKTLMSNCAFSETLALQIEAKYHELYKVSDDWVKDKLDQAQRVGYIVAAFGMRVRTPLLHQVVRGTNKTPRQADAEGRTAGNALGQSWGLLNTRAGSEFMGKVRKSQYRLDVRPCAQIHDAQYYLVRDDLPILKWANDNVVKACEWQEHPDIWHPTVKLGGKLALFHPSWANEIAVPNYASEDAIVEAIAKAA